MDINFYNNYILVSSRAAVPTALLFLIRIYCCSVSKYQESRQNCMWSVTSLLSTSGIFSRHSVCFWCTLCGNRVFLWCKKVFRCRKYFVDWQFPHIAVSCCAANVLLRYVECRVMYILQRTYSTSAYFCFAVIWTEFFKSLLLWVLNCAKLAWYLLMSVWLS